MEDKIFFTVVEGEVEVYLNEEETYPLEPRKALHFDGKARISVKALKESDIFVYLVVKKS